MHSKAPNPDATPDSNDTSVLNAQPALLCNPIKLEIDRTLSNWEFWCPASFPHGVHSIRDIPSEKCALWDNQLPQLLPPPTIRPEDIFKAAISRLKKPRGYCHLVRSGEEVIYSDQQREDIGLEALYNAIATPESIPTTIKTVLNVAIHPEDKIAMSPPEHFSKEDHIFQKTFPMSVNITPAGAAIDLHHGQSFDILSDSWLIAR
jgi:hypothetical protein